MQVVIIRTSLWKSFFFVLLCLMFVLMGIFILVVGEDRKSFFIAIACIGFFGFGLIVLLRQAIDRSPRIIIDQYGVFDSTLGVGRIDWEDIKISLLTAVFSNNFICLKLSNTSRYLERLSNLSKNLAKVNKSLGFGELNLNLTLVDMKPKEIQEIVMKQVVRNSIKSID